MTITRRHALGRTAASTEGAVSRELVLVVDDDDQMLRLVKRVLERAGFECVATATERPLMARRSTGDPTSSSST
jgi:ActR/RegA family two-component response regulator